jgi:ATP phosphoribosyltransferase
LKTNGLRELATLLESTARLVARPDRAGDERQRLDELTMALASVLRARGKRYVMANAPRAALEKVREVLPGLTGPTVTEVLDGGRFVAVHAVVSASSVYRTIAALKAIGCEGILVTRIERLVP